MEFEVYLPERLDPPKVFFTTRENKTEHDESMNKGSQRAVSPELKTEIRYLDNLISISI